jgi:hypothetical protein
MTTSRSTRKPSGIGSGGEIEKRMKNKLTIMPLQIRKTLKNKFEEYSMDVPQNVIDLNIDTILNHQAKWKVTKPDRWNKIISAISNTKILNESWYKSGSLLTFETLMYNYLYPKVDEYIAKYFTDRTKDLYHTEICWYVIYKDSGNIVPHNHWKTNQYLDLELIDHCCSGAFYLKVPKESMREFHVYDKHPYAQGASKDNMRIIEEPVMKLRPEVNKLFLFPCDMYHAAVHEGKEPSMVISFNVHFI